MGVGSARCLTVEAVAVFCCLLLQGYSMEQAGVKLLKAAVWCEQQLSADTLQRVVQQLLAGATAVAGRSVAVYLGGC